MAKRIELTRERKIALPVIISAARSYLEHAGLSSTEYKRLRDALEAFKDV